MSTTAQIKRVLTRDKGVCSVEGCEKPHLAKGLCGMHWQRQAKHGTTEPQERRTPVADRFWLKVSPTGFCWEWTGAHDRNGYGMFNRGDKVDRAHRVAYELLVGEIPEGLHLDHLCRNRGCCNPDHLEPVTPRVNMTRGEAPTVRAGRMGICLRGHSLGDAYVRPDTGARMCRTCMKMRQARRANS